MTYAGWTQCRVKPLRIQQTLFCEQEKELTKAEYQRLVRAAQIEGDDRLALLLQTICATGIRVSEVVCITAEAVKAGRAQIHGKGKRRVIFLPKQLQGLLRRYAKQRKIKTGPIFITRSGKPMDRSNIWRSMKALCQQAQVSPEKVFPHNLRHLFARTYYQQERDLNRLADLLGHSSVNTTRIYTMESGYVHAQQIEKLRLIIT